MFKNSMPDDYYQTQIVNSFTKFNIKNTNYNTPIYQRNPEVKGRLSLNHIEFIEFFVRLIKPKSFLELGVQFGECTKQIIELIPESYVGVDIKQHANINFFLKKYNHFKFIHNSTDEFFKTYLSNDIKFDMIFIDACHSHVATYQDFLNAKNHINEDGYIFFHDCYPFSSYWTTPTLCGDGYKTSEKIRKHHNNDFEILTIPVNPGISVARKCSKQLYWL